MELNFFIIIIIIIILEIVSNALMAMMFTLKKEKAFSFSVSILIDQTFPFQLSQVVRKPLRSELKRLC